MIVNVKLFASARERACADSVALIVSSPATLSYLRKLMDETVPALRGVSGRWAVNLEFAPDDYVVQMNDEVVWIPPVSGG